MTVRDLREALADAPEWRPVILSIETDDRDLVVDLNLIEDYNSCVSGDVAVMLVGHEDR